MEITRLTAGATSWPSRRMVCTSQLTAHIPFFKTTATAGMACSMMREARPTASTAGLAAGIAGHNPAVFEYAAENLDVDFYMCSHYNPTPRDEDPAHVSTDNELFSAKDRQKMIEVIGTLKKPVIHYKIMAAGRNDPQQAFAFTASHMKANDAVCVGVYTKDKRNILEENIRLLKKNIQKSTPAV